VVSVGVQIPSDVALERRRIDVAVAREAEEVLRERSIVGEDRPVPDECGELA
jgi:predicted phosphoribosyltransferase